MKRSLRFVSYPFSMALSVVIGCLLCGVASADKTSGAGWGSSNPGSQVDFLLGDFGLDLPAGNYVDFVAILDGGESGKGGRTSGGGVTKMVVIPEPASGLLLITALGCLAGRRHKRI
jgi:hypothetical protein